MNRPHGAKRPKLSPTESFSVRSSIKSTEKSIDISTDGSPILRLPKELLSTIIDSVPRIQWPSLELVNGSFRDAVYSSWQAMKEFNMEKDILDVLQSVKGIRLSDILPTILAKLLLRSPMLHSIIGFPPKYRISDEGMARYRFDILQIMGQFTNLKRIDFCDCGLNSMELMDFLTSSASRDQLKEITSSGDYYISYRNWLDIFADREQSDPQASQLKLEKLHLKPASYRDATGLDPRIVDLIDPSSLTVLVLDKIFAPSDYLLSLIANCNQLQQLQFSFMLCCRCENWPCVHLANSKQILESIAEMECLNSLKIDLVLNGPNDLDHIYLDIGDDTVTLIERLGQRGRLVEFGLLREFCYSEEILNAIPHHLTGLKSLELIAQYCLPATLANIINNLVNLEKFTFNYADYSSCGDLLNVNWDNASRSAVLQAMAAHPKLRTVHLCWPYNVNDLHILTGMERLEELSIVSAYCNNIEWESAFGHQLKSLELRNCSEDFLAAFLKQVPGVRRLVLSGNIRNKDKILRMIPTACPRLQELYMLPTKGFCGDSMKVGVQAIIDGCPEFENLQC